MIHSISELPQIIVPDDGLALLATDRPQWDVVRRLLRVGQCVVKVYRVPSPNQTAILEAFQEEDWPHRVDDPLSPLGDIEPKCRLHDTIKQLNRHHQIRIIRFWGDGTGEGVCWGYLEAAATKSATKQKNPHRAAVLPLPAATPKKKLRRAA